MSLNNRLSSKIPIKYNHWAFKLPLLKRYNGIVIGRKILFKKDKDEISEALLRHEMIHQEQMDRHSVLMFYLIYLKDYFINLLKHRSHDLAYKNIPFEVEAFKRQEKDPV